MPGKISGFQNKGSFKPWTIAHEDAVWISPLPNFYNLQYILGQQISAVPHHDTLNCNTKFWGTFFRGQRAGQEEEYHP